MYDLLNVLKYVLMKRLNLLRFFNINIQNSHNKDKN